LNERADAVFGATPQLLEGKAEQPPPGALAIANFGKPLPHLLGARSTSEFAKPEILESA
jgi:hypothetical protein